MLAGCSSTLLSPRHRLRTEVAAAAAEFQASSMSTHRLDLHTSFTSFQQRKDVSSRSQAVRPMEAAPPKGASAACSLKQSLVRPATARARASQARKEIKDEEFWEEEGGRSLKRSADDIIIADDDDDDDESSSCINRIKKRKESCSDDYGNAMDRMSFVLGNEKFAQPPGLQIPRARVCFVPPSSPLRIPSWVESGVVNEEVTITNTNLGDTSFRPPPVKERSGSGSGSGSGSISSSESHSHSLGLEESGGGSEQHELGSNGLIGGHGSITTSSIPLAGDDEDYIYRQGLELTSLLVGCVEAISSGNVAAISYFISKLGDSASPRGPSSISRVVAYFTEALALRVARVWPHVFRCTIPRELERRPVYDDDAGMGMGMGMSMALRVLNHITPIPKFIYFTANEILLGAFEGKERVHIIDFDINKQGLLQWPSLFQSFALRRPNPPSHVRITGIGECKQELIETGERLAGVAESLKLPFEFHAVVDRLEDVRLWMLHVKERESVAVNCIFQMHKTLNDDGDDGGRVLKDFLGLIRSTNPVVVIMGEQEGDHNEVPFDKRVCKSLRYYSAIFDSIETSCRLLPLDSPARIKVEEAFAGEIRNIVVCEGAHRFERHESFRWWRGALEQDGFRCLGISERGYLQSQMILKMYGCESSSSYNVEKQQQEQQDNNNNNTSECQCDDAAVAAALTLKWLDQPLYTVSAWAPVDVAGSSSRS
ncbi:hypothetical protein Dimus_008772 [Dionaea muscipula]